MNFHAISVYHLQFVTLYCFDEFDEYSSILVLPFPCTSSGHLNENISSFRFQCDIYDVAYNLSELRIEYELLEMHLSDLFARLISNFGRWRDVGRAMAVWPFNRRSLKYSIKNNLSCLIRQATESVGLLAIRIHCGKKDQTSQHHHHHDPWSWRHLSRDKLSEKP